jgi:hypothetical protein
MFITFLIYILSLYIGISGRFPESDNMEEFRQNLLNGVDMVTDDARRWPQGNHMKLKS